MIKFSTRKLQSCIVLAAMSVLVGSCSIQRAQVAADAQKSMIGMPKERILACMGAPANSAKAGGTEVWSFYSGNGHTTSVGSAVATGGNGFATAFGSATSTARSCKVDIVMNDDRVTRVNYSGPTGGLLTKGEQCAFAVENCVP